MNYKSPIEIIWGETLTSIEKGVCKAVQKCDIKVNKEELIKALEYDRSQYVKGYTDGYNACLEEISREEE